MKRHEALVALSHDHHRTLVEARRLRRAADGEDPAGAVAPFLDFFTAHVVPHFREEEETLFPLVAGSDEARPLLVQALLDHQLLHASVARLDDSPDPRAAMLEIGELLDAHVRREERELFPLIERLAAAELERRRARAEGRGGPVWGRESEDLNATLLAWGPGGGTAEHVNGERDVLIYVVDGSATVGLDDEERELQAGDALIVPKGRRRRITARRGGVRYLSVHLRRTPLQIRRAGRAS